MGGEDRISALHEDLLGAILTRLPVRDAARTAILASRWRHLWRSTPLVLHDRDLPEAGRAAIAARVLADHPGPFRNIRLAHCSFASLDLELVEWPRLIAAKGTQILALCNKRAKAPFVSRRLPADILSGGGGSLQKLNLAFLMLPDDLPGVADGFPNLRELCLIRTATSDEDLEYLLAASPVLETLVFVCDLTPKCVHVCSKSLRCALVGLSRVEEFTVVDAPLLLRIIFFQPPYGGLGRVTVKIASAPNLRVLGYLEPRIHRLQIGDNFIKPDTVASPSTMTPSVRILALKVNFGVLWEVKMLVSFLRCFPNVDTLHIQSVLHDPALAADSKPNCEHHRFSSFTCRWIPLLLFLPLALSSFSVSGRSGRLRQRPVVVGKAVRILLARLFVFLFLLNKVDLGRLDFLPDLRALAMVDGVAAIGGGLELRSSLLWPDLVLSLQDSMVCRSPRDGFWFANPLLTEALFMDGRDGAILLLQAGDGITAPLHFIILENGGHIMVSGEEIPLHDWQSVSASLTCSDGGHNWFISQDYLFRPIAPCEDFSWLVMCNMWCAESELQLDNDQIDDHMNAHTTKAQFF